MILHNDTQYYTNGQLAYVVHYYETPYFGRTYHGKYETFYKDGAVRMRLFVKHSKFIGLAIANVNMMNNI